MCRLQSPFNVGVLGWRRRYSECLGTAELVRVFAKHAMYLIFAAGRYPHVRAFECSSEDDALAELRRFLIASGRWESAQVRA